MQKFAPHLTQGGHEDWMKVLVNIHAMSFCVLASVLISGFGTLGDDDLVLKIDQKRLGFTFKVVRTQRFKEGFYFPKQPFLTEALSLRNFSFR